MNYSMFRNETFSLINETTNSSLLEELYPTKIRVVYAKNPPDAFANCKDFPTLAPSFNCPFPGWCVEIMSMMASAAGLEIEPIIYPNKIGSLNWGTLEENGTWTGVASYLLNDIADTACLLYQRTDLRDLYFDVSYPVTNVQPIFVVRRRVENIGSLLWNAFKPYSTVTWIVLLASLIAQILVMVVISRTEVSMGKRKQHHGWEMAWDAVQLQLDEKSESMMFFTFSGNLVLFMFSLLQAGLFIYLYEGLLLSALLQKGDTNPFKTADDVIPLIAKGEYHLTTNYIGNWYFDELRNSNSSHFVALRAATANNPVVPTSSVSESLDLVEQGKYIYPIQEDSIAMQMSKLRCDLVYISEGLPQRPAHLLFKNNSRFTEIFNKQIIMQQQFIQRTFRKYFSEGYKLGDIPKCSNTEVETPATKLLDLKSVIGLFTLLGIGIVLSLVALAVEVAIYWHIRIIALRSKARNAFGDAANLLALAEVHFNAKSDRIDIVKLTEISYKNKENDA